MEGGVEVEGGVVDGVEDDVVVAAAGGPGRQLVDVEHEVAVRLHDDAHDQDADQVHQRARFDLANKNKND